MRSKIGFSLLALILLAPGLSNAADKNEEKRAKTRKMAAQTLQDLYKLQPTAQAAIQKAAGYGVFDNMGTNLLVLSTARGSGIAVNSKSKQETFMKMVSAGAGLGVGVKDYPLTPPRGFPSWRGWHGASALPVPRVDSGEQSGQVREKATLEPQSARSDGADGLWRNAFRRFPNHRLSRESAF